MVEALKAALKGYAAQMHSSTDHISNLLLINGFPSPFFVLVICVGLWYWLETCTQNPNLTTVSEELSMA